MQNLSIWKEERDKSKSEHTEEFQVSTQVNRHSIYTDIKKSHKKIYNHLKKPKHLVNKNKYFPGTSPAIPFP